MFTSMQHRLLGSALGIALMLSLSARCSADVTDYTVNTVGGADQLTSVTVNGVTYSISEIVNINMTNFKGGSNASNLAGVAGAGTPAMGMRSSLLEDNILNTGVINPGGSSTPPITDPTTSTPGFAFNFNIPIVNKPGDDVVFFELQLSDPAAGDAINVSPLSGLGAGLNSITIDSYDIQLNDPKAFTLSNFDLFSFQGGSPQSLAALENNNLNAPSNLSNFQALAVGIDLSDLGYAEGDVVEGLFIQDNNGGGSVVDPVFIGGLHPIPEPTSLIIFVTTGCCGAGGYLVRRRRRSKSASHA